MEIDEKVVRYFKGRIKQVFVYLTSRCQLRCKQCLYKPLLTHIYDDLPFTTLSDLLSVFREYGAFKLSFLGGEPTLYHDLEANKRFGDIVAEGKRLGYSYVRADTNGQFEKAFLLDNNVKKLDELTFSIDGCTAEIHDAIRGKNGAFKNSISRIQQAVELGYKVQITTCVHREICKSVKEGIYQIENMIHLCESLGVTSLNFHPILKVGVARDEWIDYTEIDPYVWVDIYREMLIRLDRMKSKVSVRVPMRYVESESFTEEYDYCPLNMGERALIMPDGQIKICAFNIGTRFCLARFSNDHVIYEPNYNEYEKAKGCDNVCCNQTSPHGFRALCMSYKPNQNEVVWHNLEREGRL